MQATAERWHTDVDVFEKYITRVNLGLSTMNTTADEIGVFKKTGNELIVRLKMLQNKMTERLAKYDSGCFSWSEHKVIFLSLTDLTTEVLSTLELGLFYYGPTKTWEQVGFACGAAVVVLNGAAAIYREKVLHQTGELNSLIGVNQEWIQQASIFQDFINRLEQIKKKEEAAIEILRALKQNEKRQAHQYNADESTQTSPSMQAVSREEAAADSECRPGDINLSLGMTAFLSDSQKRQRRVNTTPESQARHHDPLMLASAAAAGPLAPHVIIDINPEEENALEHQKLESEIKDYSNESEEELAKNCIASYNSLSTEHFLKQKLAHLESLAQDERMIHEQKALQRTVTGLPVVDDYGMDDQTGSVVMIGEAAAAPSPAAQNSINYHTLWLTYTHDLIEQLQLPYAPKFIQTLEGDRLTIKGLVTYESTPSTNTRRALASVSRQTAFSRGAAETFV